MNSAKLAIFTSNISPKASFLIGRGSLKLRKNAPHVMFGAGIVGFVATTVLASKATLQLPETLSRIEKDIDNARGADQDVTYAYVKAVGKLGKLYGPAIGVGALSIAALGGAHHNLTRRNTSLMAAYATLQGAYDSYRDRVRAELGDDRELEVYRGLVKASPDDEDGPACLSDPSARSAYARLFDEYTPHWQKDAERNRFFIQCQQNYANDLLRARGHLFLNEVYNMLGIDHSREGSVVGWIINGDGDNYVDFGLNRPDAAPFINGWEYSVLLDFNVDGIMYDKI